MPRKFALFASHQSADGRQLITPEHPGAACQTEIATAVLIYKWCGSITGTFSWLVVSLPSLKKQTVAPCLAAPLLHLSFHKVENMSIQCLSL